MAAIRLFNLIEHLNSEHYILMEDVGTTKMPQRLDFEPDSPEWFVWLDKLSSFHFKGRDGHFTARHEVVKKQDEHAKPLRYWYAYRKLHSKQHKHYLGATSQLTIAKLEHAAETLYATVLASLPEDERLTQQAERRPSPQGLTLRAVNFLWDEGILQIKPSATGAQFLTQRQTGELLTYLYEHRESILKK